MKTAIITGGNSGIGKAVATALAKKNYRIILHGRDPEKTKRAEEEIKRISGNSSVESIAVDVSSLAGMKQLGEEIRKRTDVIHALVLSTGVILPKRAETVDGLEMGFVIQYLNRFATTQLLMNELTKGRAHIVMVGAPKIAGAAIHFEDIALKENFTMVRAMAQEMFANHLFVQEFARRHPQNEIIVNMANVGVANTGIVRHSNPLFKWALKLVGTPPEKAAANFVYLASDDSVNFSGYFLTKPGKPEKKEKEVHDPEVARKLWEKSMELIKPILK